MTTTTDETLGAAVGAALRAGTGSVTVRPLDLGRVERGARRRRNRRRGAAAATGVVLTVAMGWALTTRSDSTEPAEPPVAPSTTVDASADAAPVLPAFAIDELDGPPLRMQLLGAQPMGVPTPAVDVYVAGDETLVVRTSVSGSVGDPESAGDAEVADDTEVTVATTAAATDRSTWFGTETDAVSMRGVDAALLQLADDQWALRLPGVPAGGETALIGRHMSLDRFRTLVESAVAAADGTLSFGAPFEHREHADATSPTAEVGPFASFNRDAVHSVFTWLPQVGHRTLETLTMFGIPVPIVRLGNRDVLVAEGGEDRSAVTWIEPSGLAISHTVDDDELSTAVSGVQLVDATTWVALADAASARVAAEVPEVARTDVDGITLIGRGADGPSSPDGSTAWTSALCVVLDGAAERCDVEWSVGGDITGGTILPSLDASVVVGGQWILAGYRSFDDDTYGDPGDLRFTSAGGTCCDVLVTIEDGGLWYVVRVASGIDVVTTNIGEVFDGPAGDLSRPPIVDG